ncbi:hypothetical protein LINGRAHAP2_LOCUS821 [Linum grandiflorum]
MYGEAFMRPKRWLGRDVDGDWEMVGRSRSLRSHGLEMIIIVLWSQSIVCN